MTQEQLLTIEAMKIDLKTIYNEIVTNYLSLKPKIQMMIKEEVEN